MRRWIILLILECGVAFAENETQEIPVVKITANSLSDSSVLATNNTATVITSEEIANNGAQNLADVLANVSGIQLFSTTGNSEQSTVSMRGFGENAYANTVILLDGYPLTNPDMTPVDLNSIPLKNIAYIEVYPGSYSVLAGDGAVGGVVNIVTQATQKPLRQIGAEAGSFHQAGINGAVGNYLPSGISYYLSGNQWQNNHYRDHDRTALSDITTRLGYHHQQSDIQLHYQLLNESQQYPGALTSAQLDEDRQMVEPGLENSFSHAKTQLLLVTANQKLNSHWQLHGIAGERFFTNSGSLFSEFSENRNVMTVNPELRGQGNHLVNRTGMLVEHDNFRYELPSSSVSNVYDTRQSMGIYSWLQWLMTSHFSTDAGIRWAGNYDTMNHENTVSRLMVSEQSIHLKPHTAVDFYMRNATNFRFPKADEQANTDPDMPPASLKTQRGQSIEAGVNWQHWRGEFMTEIYRLSLKNEIAYAPPSQDENRATNRNLDPTEHVGFLMSERVHLIHQVMLALSYTHVNPYYKSGPFKNNAIPGVAKNVSQAALHYESLRNWNVFFEAVMTGSRFASEDDANTGGLLGAYTTYNAGVGYHWKDIKINFRINNITNKKYYNYVVMPVDSFFYYPASLMSVLLKISYEFQ